MATDKKGRNVNVRVSPMMHDKMAELAKLRFIETRRNGGMPDGSISAYVRWLVARDLVAAQNEIRTRRGV